MASFEVMFVCDCHKAVTLGLYHVNSSIELSDQ